MLHAGHQSAGSETSRSGMCLSKSASQSECNVLLHACGVAHTLIGLFPYAKGKEI